MVIPHSNIILYSNNPKVTETLTGFEHVQCHSYEDVLLQARDAVHNGQHLLTHPLAGSVKPGESPYRSVAITKQGGALDMRSLEIIESAIDRLRVLTEHRETRKYPQETLDDFQLIDYNLLLTGLEAMLGGHTGIPES